jgi:hypothetical protein
MTPKQAVVDKRHTTTIGCLRNKRWLCTHLEIRGGGEIGAPLKHSAIKYKVSFRTLKYRL